MGFIDRQAAFEPSQRHLTVRHRAPNGVPAQAKTWVGDEGTPSRTEPSLQPTTLDDLRTLKRLMRRLTAEREAGDYAAVDTQSQAHSLLSAIIADIERPTVTP